MKTETYTCNLCGKKTDTADLVALVAATTVSGTGWKLAARFCDWHGGNRHVCKECIKLIKEFKP